MLNPNDPTHPQIISSGIGGIPTDIAIGPDGNVWFTESTSHAIGMLNTTNPTHPITIYNSADGLPANAEPQGITRGVDSSGRPVVWFTDTINNALGRIDPTDPTHIPAEIPTPAGKIGFLKYTASKITPDSSGNLWFSEVTLDVNSHATSSAIARYTPQNNQWSEWALPTGSGEQPLSVIIGQDGHPWFSAIVPNGSGGVASSLIGSVNPANPVPFQVLVQAPTGGAVPDPVRITAGPGDTIWYTDQANAAIGQYNALVTPAFRSLPVPGSPKVDGITTDSNGDFWFTAISGSHSNLGAVSHATHIVIPGAWEPPATVKAGAPFSVTAFAADSFGNPDPGYSGTATLTLAPSGNVDGTSSAAASGGFFIFSGATVNNAGTGYTLGLTAPGLTPTATTKFDVTGNSNNNGATHLQVAPSTEPPATVAAGSGINVTVFAANATGAVDTNYNGTVTVSLSPGGAVLGTATASAGSASFPGLIVNVAGTYQLLFSASGLTGTATRPFTVTSQTQVPPPQPVPPVIIGETPIFTQKRNRKGKPIGKPVLTGFQLNFSEPMNTSTAGNSGNYVVEINVLKRVKRKRVTVLQPVGSTASMVSSTSVQLLTGSQKFQKGGKIILSTSPPGGISGANGALLDSSYGTFTILVGGKGITRP